MQCPKCGHIQENTVTCARCGIIFAKYEERRVRQKKPVSEPVNQPVPVNESSGGQLIKVAFVLIFIAAIGLTGFKLFFSENTAKSTHTKTESYTESEYSKNQPSETARTVNSEKEKPNTVNPEPGQISTVSTRPVSTPMVENGLKQRLYSKFQPQTELEKARLATVFIKTSWGLGSGFFISSDGHIITNRHVIEFDESKKKDIQLQLDLYKDTIAKNTQSIKDAKEYMESLTDPTLKYDMKLKIQDAEKQLQQQQDTYRELDNTFYKIKYSAALTEYTIILYDDTEYTVKGAVVSKDDDLALLKLDEVDCPFLETGSTRQLRTGHKVYTIGNPVGLSYTITSGIISGFRMINDKKFIQTDAPINPGNSGGPLIDTDGKVLGINTMVVKGTSGIGFAIPIEIVSESFSDIQPDTVTHKE